MRFVGQSEVAAFLSRSSVYNDAIRSWVTEMKSGQWRSTAALTADYQYVDVTASPTVVFYLVPASLRIRTLINFRVGVVMLVAIDLSAAWQHNQPQPLDRAP